MPSEVKITVDELPVSVKEDAVYIINQPNPNSFTHNYFKYPCKFIPEIPRWAIKSFVGNDTTGAKILDPFAGSGTSLLEASLAGATAYGAEIDDVAKLIIKVKTTPLSSEQIKLAKESALAITEEIESQKYDISKVIYPGINNLNHWFREDILKDLGFLYSSILDISDDDTKDFLLICMASIIKRVSNCDDISPKPYVSNNIIKNPPPVSKTFMDTVDKYLVGMSELSGYKLSPVIVAGDATNLPFENSQFDLAVTSPPYINAFDYVRTLRLENLWLNMTNEDDLREKKKQYLGTECIRTKKERENLVILEESDLLRTYFDAINQVDEKRALITKKFFEDMKTNMQEVYRTLKPGAKYVIVIGNSSIRKIDVESWRVLKDLAQVVGFKYSSHIGYEIQNPYIRIPRGNKGGKIAIDHMLIIER